ncbi:MAG: helix-turn-helix domain-containing protein, partial [Anaerolineae bacterium]|nr:helix-turn-helix domain-containing protein [Anaerolineae bacterium]
SWCGVDVMFKDRLRDLRLSLGLTQDELAERVGCEVLQIWRYESGKAKPTMDYIVSLAASLNTSADYLLGLSDDPTPHELKVGLNTVEREVLAALRRGEKYEAIKAIVELGETK